MNVFKINTEIKVRYGAVGAQTGITDLLMDIIDPNGDSVSGFPVTMSELSNGMYESSFTPTSTGVWWIKITSVTYPENGYSKSYIVSESDTSNGQLFILVDENGNAITSTEESGGRRSLDVNITGTAITGVGYEVIGVKDSNDLRINPAKEDGNLADIKTNTDNLDVALSTIASETTLVQVRDYLDTVETKLQSIRDQLDVVLSSRASETTSQSILEALGEESGTNILNELKSIASRLDVDLSTVAKEVTLIQVRDYLDTVETKLQTIRDQLDVTLSTRASESTSQEIRDTIGQESGSTVLSRLKDLWDKLVELFVTSGTAKVKIHDGTNEVAVINSDGTNRLAVDAQIVFRDDAIITMEHWLRKTYDGYVFNIHDIFTKQTDQYRYILLHVPSGYNAFLRWQLTSELGLNFQIFESPTITNNGTAHSIFNLNRASSNLSNISAYYDSIISNEGTEIICQLLNGSNQSSASGINDLNVVMKEDTYYLLKLVSNGNGNEIGYNINWFEEEVVSG